jgi:hypothetical protein
MESPFASRLDSNYAATDSESLEIQSLLVLPEFRLEELSAQLQELDKQSAHITNEQSVLLLFISKHRALISLIRKLPIEILQEIFIACLPTAHNPVMSREEPPILLTQICSSWRNVAHATPQLWKSIHIAISFSKNLSSMTVEQHSDRRSEAVQEWLSRSAAYPLHISLGQLGTSDLDDFYDKIINSLIRFSERWKEILFTAPYQALVPIASLPPSKVPLLETLSLNCPPGGPTTANFTQLDLQSVWNVLKAPNLHDLWLHGPWLTHRNEDVTRLPINWSQLTNISLERTTWGACFLSVSTTYKLLTLCRNLITCQLEIGSIADSEDSEELPLETTTALISLPFLTRLSVREYTSVSRLLTLLHLPSLSSIEFHTEIRPTQHSSTSLLSFLSHFHNTIQLITAAEYFTRQEFIKCLRLCPLLKSLSIQEGYRGNRTCVGASPGHTLSCRINDAFLKLFFESSNDEGYLCSHLEDFSSTSGAAFSDTTLLQFVKEKNGASTTSTGLAKLKHLYVLFNCRSLNDINPELEPYKQAGLVATIIYPLSTPFSTTYIPRPLSSAFFGLPRYAFARHGLPGSRYMSPY